MAEKVLNDKSANEKVYDIFNMPYVKENPRVNPTAKKILNDEFTLTDIRKIYKEAKEKLYDEATSDLLDDYVYWGPSRSHSEDWGYDSSDMVGGMGYNIFTVKDVAFTDQGYGMTNDLKRTDKFDISLELALWSLYNSRYDEDEASEFLDQMESDSEIAFEDIQEELNEIWEKEENERQTKDAESKKVYGVKGQVTMMITLASPNISRSSNKAELKYAYDIVADVDLPQNTQVLNRIIPVDFNLTGISNPNDFDKRLGNELANGLDDQADLEIDKIYNSNPFKVSFDFIPYNKQKAGSMKYILYQSPKNNKYYITSKGIGIENLKLFWNSQSLNYKSMAISKTASSGHRYTVDAVKDIALNRSNFNQSYLAIDDEEAYNKFIVPANKENIVRQLGLRILFLVDYHVDLEITEGNNKTKKVGDYSGAQKLKEIPAKL